MVLFSVCLENTDMIQHGSKGNGWSRVHESMMEWAEKDLSIWYLQISDLEK